MATTDVETVVGTILKHGPARSATGRCSSCRSRRAYRIRTGEPGEETLQAHPEAAVEVADDGERRGVARRAVPSGPSLREVYQPMLEAVLGGGGLGEVAEPRPRRRARR